MLIKIKDVAEILGVSQVTIYRMLDTKEIPALKVGGSWRFDRKEIDKYVEKQKAEYMGVAQ